MIGQLIHSVTGLQFQAQASSLLTSWLTAGLLTQQPTTWSTCFPDRQPTIFQTHQQPLMTDAILQQNLSAGIQEMQLERPPIQAPPRYQVTSIPPPRPHSPAIPRPQSEPSSDRGSLAGVQTTESVTQPKVMPTSVPPQGQNSYWLPKVSIIALPIPTC